MVRRLNNYLIEQLFMMDEEEISAFIAGLKPKTRKYLDVILEKAEEDPNELKTFLDAK